MRDKLASRYLVSAGLILAFTAVAKVASSGSSARALQTIEPFFGLHFGTLFLCVGLLELVVSHYVLKWTDIFSRAMLVAWISTGFLIYRIGLVWVGYHKPCGCMGTFTDALHLSPQAADTIMKLVLAYLLAGSYACLLAYWKRGTSAGRSLSGAEGVAQAQSGATT